MAHRIFVNVAAFVADHLGRVGRATSGGISVGGIITQITNHFGYDPVVLDKSLIVGNDNFNMTSLVNQGIIQVESDHYAIMS